MKNIYKIVILLPEWQLLCFLQPSLTTEVVVPAGKQVARVMEMPMYSMQGNSLSPNGLDHNQYPATGWIPGQPTHYCYLDSFRRKPLWI
jgi:hypothetical protein